MFIVTLSYNIHDTCHMKCLWTKWSHFCIEFALRKFYFRGWRSATPQNRGRSKKTQGPTALKSRGGSLAVSSYLQRGSAPPPPPGVEPRMIYTDIYPIISCNNKLSHWVPRSKTVVKNCFCNMVHIPEMVWCLEISLNIR